MQEIKFKPTPDFFIGFKLGSEIKEVPVSRGFVASDLMLNPWLWEDEAKCFTERKEIGDAFAQFDDYRFRVFAAQADSLPLLRILGLANDPAYDVREALSKNKDAMEYLDADELVALGSTDRKIAVEVLNKLRVKNREFCTHVLDELMSKFGRFPEVAQAADEALEYLDEHEEEPEEDEDNDIFGDWNPSGDEGGFFDEDDPFKEDEEPDEDQESEEVEKRNEEDAPDEDQEPKEAEKGNEDFESLLKRFGLTYENREAKDEPAKNWFEEDCNDCVVYLRAGEFRYRLTQSEVQCAIYYLLEEGAITDEIELWLMRCPFDSVKELLSEQGLRSVQAVREVIASELHDVVLSAFTSEFAGELTDEEIKACLKDDPSSIVHAINYSSDNDELCKRLMTLYADHSDLAVQDVIKETRECLEDDGNDSDDESKAKGLCPADLIVC